MSMLVVRGGVSYSDDLMCSREREEGEKEGESACLCIMHLWHLVGWGKSREVVVRGYTGLTKSYRSRIRPADEVTVAGRR